jgi:ubiquitin carboxyl-terminal hydrolase 7
VWFLIVAADVLLFFKLYSPATKTISYCGHHYMPITEKLADIEPMLCKRGGFPPNTPLVLFEEVRLESSLHQVIMMA